MEFERKQSISKALAPKRALLIYGPRRVGKTTMLKKYLKTLSGKKVLAVNGDDLRIRNVINSEMLDDILDLVRPYDVIAIDEAQQIEKIGIGTKMMIDAFPEKTVVLTGSSSFELTRQIGEPLTGRHYNMSIMPIAQSEMRASRFELRGSLEKFLIYGTYPEILLAADDTEREKILNELLSSYLFKDVLALDRIKSPALLTDILKCLAFQVGGEVSFNEIARTVGSNPNTVQRYVDLLEKMFVIIKVRGFSRNLRTEISKKAKYYFMDNGVRNAVIGAFNPVEMRNDLGQLWENFIFMELMRESIIAGRSDRYYFWRTHAGQEVDIVRERNSMLEGIECKWSDRPTKPPRIWIETYPEASFTTINRENYLDILLGQHMS